MLLPPMYLKLGYNDLKVCLNLFLTDIMNIFLVSTSGIIALVNFILKWIYSNFLSQLSLTQSVTITPISLQMSPVSTCVM